MCGRTACTLAPEDIAQSCGYMTADGCWVQPRWRDAPGGRKYYPSYNMAPSAHSPVMFSKMHAQTSDLGNSEAEPENLGELECDWVIQPMHWGLIPSWHHGDQKNFSYKMNNARSDGLLSKASFKKPLDMGRRCVVLAEGYYEWNTSKDGKKQPFFIHFTPQQVEKNPSLKMEMENVTLDSKAIKTEIGSDGDMDSKSNEQMEDNKKEEDSETRSTAGNKKRLLTMAGLFDIWTGKDGETLYSYSIITVDAHPDLACIHERMPAILDGEKEVQMWLDYKTYPLETALKLVRPTNCLKFYPVSSAVNDSRNKSPECMKEIDLKAATPLKASASSSFMKSWLKTGTGQVKRELTEDTEPNGKKIKL